MADGGSPQPTQGSDLPPSQPKRRSSEPVAGGKKKAKTKHLTSSEPSRSAEREASRRHLALEKEFSKAQRLRSREVQVIPPAPLGNLPAEPSSLPSHSAPRAWSPQGGTEQVRLSSPLQQGPRQGTPISPNREGSNPAHPEGAASERSLWTQQFQAFMQQAFDQFMSSSIAAGPSQVSTSPHLPVGPLGGPHPTGSGISEASSQMGDSDSAEFGATEGPMSEDEETAPDPAPFSGLLDPSLFKSLLARACSTTSLESEKEARPSTSTAKDANPLFARKVVEERQVPCPDVVLETIEKEWASLASLPSASSLEKKLYNVASPFSALLEVPTVDAPLTSLFSTTTVPGDMAEHLKAEDKRFEFSLRRAHQASAWAIRASSASSFFARTSIMWLRQLMEMVPPDQVRMHQYLGKLLTAAEYVSDASLTATKFSARSIAASVASRRFLWLKQWRTDLKSKWRLSTDSYKGKDLFGSILEPYLIEGKDKRKSLAHPSKKSDRRPQQEFRRQAFRSGNSWEWRQPFRSGQSWEWPRGSRSFAYRQDRQQDRQNSGARGQPQGRRPFRGAGGRPFRRSK